MINRHLLITRLAEKAEGKMSPEELRAHRAKLHAMGASELAEFYKKEMGKDPYSPNADRKVEAA